MKGKKILSMLLTCCLAITLTACGNKSGSGASGAGNNPSGTNTPASGSGNSSAPAKAKDSVIVACAAEPDAFFPYHSKLGTNMDEVPILHNVYETPIKLDKNNKHEPLLAEKWEISEDGKVYTLHLRKNVTFQSGNKMTAQDVAFSLDLGGKSTAGAAQLANYDHAEVVDDSTVKIYLTSPYGPFLNALAGRYALIIEKALFEKVGEDGYHKAPIGTGPYKFVERVSGDKITLKANESYWGGAPAIKNVTFKVITDTNTQMVSLENGDIDVLINANISPLLKLPKDKVKWDVADASSIATMNFNASKGPAKDINFRKAVQAGINKDEVNIGVYEGKATIGDIPMAPFFSGRPDKGKYKVVNYDEKKAKEYLAASGYKGEEFKILTVAGTKNESAAQVVQGQLIALGIKCTVNAVDAASYDASTKAGDYGATIRAAGVSVMDADGLYFMYYSKQLLKPGNYDAGVTSAKMDDLLVTGRVETNANKRKEIYGQAADIITDNAYGVTLYYDANACAYNANLKGVVPRALTGLYYFNDWKW